MNRMTMNERIVEITGWYGVLAVLGAYAGATFGLIDATGIAYQVLNLTGAMGVLAVSLRRRAYQPAALNAIWGLVGVIALIRLYFA